MSDTSPVPREPIYDLVTEQADYPPLEGLPRKTLLICTHPRSGSTFLGEVLYAIGGCGCPLEYIHRGFRPKFMERWQAPTLVSLLEAAHRHRTDSMGVFSAKLFWLDIEDLLTEISPALLNRLRVPEFAALPPGPYQELFTLLQAYFPNPTFVYLSRRDRVRQAVSGLVATQTRRWRLIPEAPRRSPAGQVEYDYERILGLIALSDYCNLHWRNFFAANALRPHEIHYEEMITSPSPALGRLCASLGYEGELPASRMRRQADARSENLVSRFLKDYCARRAPPDSPGLLPSIPTPGRNP